MSQENIKAFTRLYQAWSVGDFGVGLDVLDTNVTYVVRAPFPQQEPADPLGAPDAISDYMRRFHEQFERGSHKGQRRRFGSEVAGDTVVVDVTQQAYGAYERNPGRGEVLHAVHLPGRQDHSLRIDPG